MEYFVCLWRWDYWVCKWTLMTKLTEKIICCMKFFNKISAVSNALLVSLVTNTLTQKLIKLTNISRLIKG